MVSSVKEGKALSIRTTVDDLLHLLIPITAWSLLIFLLIMLFLPNFIRERCQGQLTACKSNLKNIGTALEMYSTAWSGHYPRNLAALTPNYLKTIPDCPTAGRVTYRLTVGLIVPLNTGRFVDYYLIECTGKSHVNVDVPANYPMYDGIQGLIER